MMVTKKLRNTHHPKHFILSTGWHLISPSRAPCWVQSLRLEWSYIYHSLLWTFTRSHITVVSKKMYLSQRKTHFFRNNKLNTPTAYFADCLSFLLLWTHILQMEVTYQNEICKPALLSILLSSIYPAIHLIIS